MQIVDKILFDPITKGLKFFGKGIDIGVGRVVNSSSSATGGIANGANITTTISSLTLDAGKWLVIAHIEFLGTSTFNFNKFCISTSASFDAAFAISAQAAVSGSHSSPSSISRIVTLNSNTTVSSIAYTWIPSGSSTYQNASMYAVKL